MYNLTLFSALTTSTGNEYTFVTPLGVIEPTFTLTSNTTGGSVVLIDANDADDATIGDSGPGINFNRSLTNPTGYSGGNLTWVQVIQSDTIQRQKISDSSWQIWSQSGLDNNVPYLSVSSNPNYTLDAPSNNLAAVADPALYKAFTRSDSYVMWLLYNPGKPNSVDVPLGNVAWTWGASLEWNGTEWDFASASAPVSAPESAGATPSISLNGPGYSFTGFPSWSAVFINNYPYPFTNE